MEKTERFLIADLLEQLQEAIHEHRASYDIYGTDRETTFLSGINQGLDTARNVLKEFDVEEYLKGNK